MSPLPGLDGGAPSRAWMEEPRSHPPSSRCTFLAPLCPLAQRVGGARDAHSPLSRGFWGSLHCLHRRRKTIHSRFQLPAAQAGRAGGMAGARGGSERQSEAGRRGSICGPLSPPTSRQAPTCTGGGGPRAGLSCRAAGRALVRRSGCRRQWRGLKKPD